MIQKSLTFAMSDVDAIRIKCAKCHEDKINTVVEVTGKAPVPSEFKCHTCGVDLRGNNDKTIGNLISIISDLKATNKLYTIEFRVPLKD